MRIIDDLRAEHDLIDLVRASFRGFGTATWHDVDAREVLKAYLLFFRVYAGAFHHEREEDILFPALQSRAGLPGDHGPIAVLTEDHHRMGAILDDIEALTDADLNCPGVVNALRKGIERYTRELAHHIDAENSVLLPESEARLRKSGVSELPCRPLSRAEIAAAHAGQQLIDRFPPVEDPSIVRGDGCVLCPAMGESCHGLERAWWNEHEWDEFEDHLPAG
jgi:hemerythrin-like domain-containing protein